MKEADKMSTVSLKKTGDNLFESVNELLSPLLSVMPLEGTSVLIKPNLVEPLPCASGQTTNPLLVEAIVVWCKKRGARSIAVGEGPSYFQPAADLRACFTKTGIAEAAHRQGIPWVLFDDGPFRQFQDCSPRTPRIFSLSEHAFSWDHIINVPVPKTHYLTTVSIAMKNLKGFIKREDKPSFHYCGSEGIHGSVTQLNVMIRPSLNIIDCTAPTHRNTRFLLASTDIVAADAVTASLMGLNPGDIQTITLGHAAGLGDMDLCRIDIIGDDLKEVHMNLEQPVDYITRVFPQITLDARSACSGCLIPLFACLHRLEDIEMTASAGLHLVLGREVSETPVDKQCLCIGQCTRHYAGPSARLEGCPPTKATMLSFLQQFFTGKLP